MRKRFITISIITVMILSLLLSAGCDDIFEQIMEIRDQLEDIELDDYETTDDSDDSDLTELPKEADIIPLNVLMGFSDYSNIQLSYDGETMMYRYGNDFIVENWKTNDKMLVEWPNDAGGIPRYLFAPDGDTILFFVDDMGDENSGLYTSNLNTGETQTIFTAGDNDCGYVSDNPANDEEIFIVKFDFNRELYDLYILDYITGDYELILKNPGDIIDFLIDSNGVLRGVGTIDDQAGVHYLLKKDPSNGNTKFVAGEWEEVLYWDYENANTSGVFGFMQDNERLLFLDTANSNTATLSTYNVCNGRARRRLQQPGLRCKRCMDRP